MSEEKGTEVLEKFVSAMDELVELGEDIFEDGKVDFSDVMHLPKAAPILEKLYDVWGKKEELVSEARDLSWEEAAKLLAVASK